MAGSSYIHFHDVRHPSEMGTPKVGALLTHLAVKENAAASTQNQAPSGLLFLYREVIYQELGPVDAQRAKPYTKAPIQALDWTAQETLYHAIVDTVASVTAHGGRSDGRALFGRPGGHRRIMDRNTVGRPCPVCGQAVEQLQ